MSEVPTNNPTNSDQLFEEVKDDASFAYGAYRGTVNELNTAKQKVTGKAKVADEYNQMYNDGEVDKGTRDAAVARLGEAALRQHVLEQVAGSQLAHMQQQLQQPDVNAQLHDAALREATEAGYDINTEDPR